MIFAMTTESGNERDNGASADADRAGGPTDLSRFASQPEALIPSAWSFAEANAWYRADVRRRMLAEAATAAPHYRARNPKMSEDQAFYTAIHGAVMTIIEQLFPNEENNHCPTVCPSDVAWDVMYALGFHEAQAIEARRATTGTGVVHESAVRQDAPDPCIASPNPTPKGERN